MVAVGLITGGIKLKTSTPVESYEEVLTEENLETLREETDVEPIAGFFKVDYKAVPSDPQYQTLYKKSVTITKDSRHCIEFYWDVLSSQKVDGTCRYDYFRTKSVVLVLYGEELLRYQKACPHQDFESCKKVEACVQLKDNYTCKVEWNIPN